MIESDKDTEPAKHVEADFDSPTPLARTTVVVSVPQTLKLVDSSVLKDYEVWSIQSSALFSVLVGIAVAMIQSGWSSALGVFGGVFLVWFGFSLAYTYKKRKQMKRNVTNVPFSPSRCIKYIPLTSIASTATVDGV